MRPRQDVRRIYVQQISPQHFDVRPRQDVRQIDVQQIPFQPSDVKPRQDERRNRPNKSQPRNARPTMPDQ